MSTGEKVHLIGYKFEDGNLTFSMTEELWQALNRCNEIARFEKEGVTVLNFRLGSTTPTQLRAMADPDDPCVPPPPDPL